MRDGMSRLTVPLLRGGERALDAASAAFGDATRTVRFLRGRATFDVRPDDLFVASYPRSGTTWTQVIAYLLTTGEGAFGFRHLAEVSPWWERSLAWRADAAAEFASLPGPRVFKTHLPYRWLPPGARYLYVRRNPEDVAVSYYHLYRRYLRFDGSFGDFFDRFLRGDLQYRSWFRHVAGWEAQQENPRVLFVSFEEMRRSPEEWIGRIAGFLGLAASPERIAEVTRQSDFSRMKAEEHKFDHIGELCLQWGIRDGSFLRAGGSGNSEGLVSAPERAALERARARASFLPSLEWRLPSFLH
jgi:hypothetical protein